MKSSTIALLALCVTLVTAAPADAQVACDTAASNSATVDFVTKTLPPPGQAPQTQNNATVSVGLQDKIYLHVKGLGDLIKEFDCWHAKQPNKQLVLYLAGLPMKDLTGTLPDPPANGFISFVLDHAVAKDNWAQVLGHPTFKGREVPISLGLADQFPIQSALSVKFEMVPICQFLFGIAMVLALGGVLIWLGVTTPLFRDGKLPNGQLSAFSLSRTQAAWWLFFIVASYLMIAAVTGDFNETLNGTALTLLGIGSATAAGGAVVSASKRGEPQAAIQTIQQKTAAQQHTVQTLTQQIVANTAPADAQARVDATSDEITANRAMVTTIQRLDNSEGFLKDILSDADGISIHRFQLVVWTIVLTFIFIKEVWGRLAMPDFDSNLLTLQGISAGTYVGLKLAEPAVPKAAAK
jgi:hypothetical protein